MDYIDITPHRPPKSFSRVVGERYEAINKREVVKRYVSPHCMPTLYLTLVGLGIVQNRKRAASQQMEIAFALRALAI